MITVSGYEYYDDQDRPTGEKAVLMEIVDNEGQPLFVFLNAAQARDMAMALCAKANAIDPVS